MSFDKIPATIDVQDLERRISELEAKVMKITEVMASFLDAGTLSEGRISELKERIVNWSVNLNRNREDTQNNKEVLRELISWLEIEWVADTGLLAKLDVPKEQTEYRYFDAKFDPYSWDRNYDLGKDSGGEKEGASRDDGRVELKDSDSTDSKPPEPYSIFSDFIPIEGKWYHLKAEIKKDSANVFIDYIQVYGDEPREDDKENMMFGVFSKETHVLVKREDLQFLFELIETDEDYYNSKALETVKRIKEEYGIE